MYKLLLTDLDDTLLNRDGTICEINIPAIQKAIEQGCDVAICSGRSNMSLEKFNKKLGIKGYTIGFNGGIIYNEDKVLVCHYLKRKLVEDIIDFCRKYKVDIQLYQHDELWLDRETIYTKIYCDRSALTPHVVNELSENLTDEVNKVIILGEHEILKNLEAALPEHITKNCCTFFSHEYLFEFNPPDITKGSALKELAEILGISTKEVIAIGDNENDLPMILEAGLGVAVKNSIADVLEKADYITENDCDNGAVAEVINKFVIK